MNVRKIGKKWKATVSIGKVDGNRTGPGKCVNHAFSGNSAALLEFERITARPIVSQNTKNQNGLLQICSKLVQDIQIILRKFV